MNFDLRSAVLQAAIQGNLTDQRTEDGTADELLEQICAEKKRLIAEGKIKREKALPPISKEEIPFDIPDNWCWVRLGEISTYGKSTAKIKAKNINKDAWILDLEDIKKGGRIIKRRKAEELKSKGDKNVFYQDDILYSKLRPYLLKILLAPSEGFCTTELVPFRCYGKINHEYIINFLKSSYTDITVNKATYGIKMPRVGKDTMLNLIVPLPPLAEQERIVERVEALMLKIDAFEEADNKLEELKKKFPEDLRDALLQAAIQGKLTDQKLEDGTAEELLEQIRAEKKRLIAEGKIKREKALPPITEDEKPFDIPENWAWVRLNDVGRWQSGATPPKTHSEFYGGNIAWLITGDLNDDFISEKDIKNRISELALSKTSVKMNPVGSVLIAMYGATIGKTGILKVPATTNQACCACLPLQGVFNEYLFWVLRAFKQTFIGMAEGGAQPNISKEKIVKTPFPLPPLAEQERIVERLNELLPLCERMR